MDTYMGTICAFAFNYAPLDWAMCSGQLLPISNYSALFYLLNTYYGGDGRSTFALPNLMGAAAIGMGQGPGLPVFDLGESGGSVTATMQLSSMPVHTHSMVGQVLVDGSGNAGNSNTPVNNYLAYDAVDCYNTNAGSGFLNPQSKNVTVTDVAGTNPPQPFSIVRPYLAINYCIAVEGYFPPRPQ